MTALAEPILLADIGGTNARFGILADRALSDIAHFVVADFPCFDDALTSFLNCVGGRKIRRAVLGAAGPVECNRCSLTNSPWRIDGNELQATFGFRTVDMINDFEAVAWSLPLLTAEDLFPLGGGRAVRGAPMAVVGPGTGLGMAAVVWRSGRPVVVATEGGHATFPSMDRREDAVIDLLRKRFGHVSAERVLSGRGIENLFSAIALLDGKSLQARTAAGITQAAVAGTCPTSGAALGMFCAMLGTVAGNLALTFRARGGIYIVGGIVPRFPDYIMHSDFRAHFENKGRFRPYLEAVPTYVVVHPDVTFLGLRSLAEQGLDMAV